ncbi:MAG: hypothetical protein ABEJ43_07780 [Haloferacaceae archaeon]
MGDSSDDARTPNPEEPFGSEYDPADQFGSPEHDLGPRVSVPDPENVDRDLATTWWASVVLANVALGAPAVGLLLVFFRGQWQVGGAAVLAGLFAALALVRTIRGFEKRRATGSEDDGAGEAESSDADAHNNA